MTGRGGQFPARSTKKEFMEKELVDKGTYYEIKDYESIIELDENGNVISAIHCPYIPKFLVDGPEIGSTGDVVFDRTVR